VRVKPATRLGDALLGNYLLSPGGRHHGRCVTGSDTTCSPVSDITMTKTVDPADGSTVTAGDSLTYTLTFTNMGEGSGRVDADDTVSGVVDDATWERGPQVSDSSLRAVRQGGMLHVTGLLEGGQTVTVAYTVKVKDYADQGDHQLLNFLGPGGVRDETCGPGDPLCTHNAIKPERRGGVLPDTGGPALGTLAGGLALVLGGGFLLVRSRRRTSRDVC
jgi:LPXTG-motif cell wall-anchored protein